MRRSEAAFLGGTPSVCARKLWWTAPEPSNQAVEPVMRRMLLAVCMLAAAAACARASDSRSLAIDGRARSYHVYRPATLGRATSVPLVLVLHGGFGSGTQAEGAYHWDEAADRGGFVVAYPDGYRRAWNAGGTCCGTPARDHLDDIAFLTAVIRTLEKDEGVDPRRIYLTGMSNGAAMSYWYACKGPVPIAAVGSVSGSFAAPCPTPRPVSVMEIHGTDDRNIPMAGGKGPKGVSDTDWLPVEETLGYFRAADDCAAPQVKKNGPVTTSAARCAAGRDVTLITVEGAGHQWPGSTRPHLVGLLLGLDPPSDALDATTTLRQFFLNHTLD